MHLGPPLSSGQPASTSQLCGQVAGLVFLTEETGALSCPCRTALPALASDSRLLCVLGKSLMLSGSHFPPMQKACNSPMATRGPAGTQWNRVPEGSLGRFAKLWELPDPPGGARLWLLPRQVGGARPQDPPAPPHPRSFPRRRLWAPTRRGAGTEGHRSRGAQGHRSPSRAMRGLGRPTPRGAGTRAPISRVMATAAPTRRAHPQSPCTHQGPQGTAAQERLASFWVREATSERRLCHLSSLCTPLSRAG